VMSLSCRRAGQPRDQRRRNSENDHTGETHNSPPPMPLASFVAGAAGSEFPLENLPWGVFTPGGTPGAARRLGTRVGAHVLDVAAAAAHVFTAAAAPMCAARRDVFAQPSLNALLGLGRAAWGEARAALQAALAAGVRAGLARPAVSLPRFRALSTRPLASFPLPRAPSRAASRGPLSLPRFRALSTRPADSLALPRARPRAARCLSPALSLPLGPPGRLLLAPLPLARALGRSRHRSAPVPRAISLSLSLSLSISALSLDFLSLAPSLARSLSRSLNPSLRRSTTAPPAIALFLSIATVTLDSLSLDHSPSLDYSLSLGR
jgi:hypothetical protein